MKRRRTRHPATALLGTARTRVGTVRAFLGTVRARACALPALGLLTVAAVAGCGVRPSDVVAAGDGATGMKPAVTVFFFAKGTGLMDSSPGGDDATEPAGLLRSAPRAGAASVAAAVRAVFAGPTEAEAPALATRLPRLPAPPSVRTEDDGILVVRLPAGVGRLTPSGMLQVVCTASAAVRAEPAGQTRPQGAQGSVGGAVAPGTPRPAVPVAVTVRVEGAGWQVTRASTLCPPG